MGVKIMLLSVLILVVAVVAADSKSRTTTIVKNNVQMSRGGSPFKVALFADLHFGENAWTNWGPLQDTNSIHVMSLVLQQEKPANNLPIANASLYWDMALSPTRGRGIPWASVSGNHDDKNFEWPLDWFSGAGIPPLNCSASTISSSLGDECNFKGTTREQLMDHDTADTKLSSSQKGSYPEITSNAQAKWFNRTSQEINPDARVPEIIFWHIPSRAYNTVAPSGIISRPCVGSINKEGVASQEAEFGIMEALEARPSVQAVFVGHNHGLDWCCPITTCGSALLGTPAMEVGLEERGYWRYPSTHSLLSNGLQWKMVQHIAMLS